MNTKQVVHVAVTRQPSEHWTAQQLRQLTPFGTGPNFIIYERDAKFGAEFDRIAEGMGIRALRTAIRTPLMNATCERFLGSVRRECHIIIVGESHRRTVLTEMPSISTPADPTRGSSNALLLRLRQSAPVTVDE